MIISAPVRGQSEKFRHGIERQIRELESRIVPGLQGATVYALREQIEALESKLRPADDKRDPRHFRAKRKRREPPAPCLVWSFDDWHTAQWAAKKRAAGVCELCQAAPVDTCRIAHLAPGQAITQHNMECVCAVCADQHPREEYFQ